MKRVKRKMAALLAMVLMMTSMPVAAAGNVTDAGADVSTGKNAAVETGTDIAADIDGKTNTAAEAGGDAGEMHTPTASGQLPDKPLGTETPGTTDAEAMGVEEMVGALYADITEDGLAELLDRAVDDFAEVEVPEGATDAEEYERMLSLVRKKVEAYLETVLGNVKAEYTELEQEEVYRAVFNRLCEKIMSAIKELFGMEEPSVTSLLPLVEKRISVDLRGLTPIELTMVPFSRIFEGEDMPKVDKIAYALYGLSSFSDEYAVADYSGYANLSRRISLEPDHVPNPDSSYHYDGRPWLMIPGGDQLKEDVVRYIVNLQYTKADSWLIPSIYTQDEMGNRAEKEIRRYDYGDTDTYSSGSRYLDIDVPADSTPYNQQLYVKLDINRSLYGEAVDGMDVRVYEGEYTTAEAAMAADEITDQILGDIDMGQKDAGYAISASSTHGITMVSFDTAGNVTGCLPLYIGISRIGSSGNDTNRVSTGSLFQRVDSGREYVYYTYTSRSTANANGMKTVVYQLYEGYPVNGNYCLTMDYYHAGNSSNHAVTAAYVGQYGSIGEAESAGAADVKEKLFGGDYDTEGYSADYSGEGVYFSIFVGQDGEGQEIYHYCIKTEESIIPKNSGNSGVGVTFYGLMDKDGKWVDCYKVKSKDDSYAEGNYPVIIVGKDVDLTKLAPEFSTDPGVNLYASGSNTPEKSGEDYHDFSNGPVHYTTASENGKNQKNVWLTVKTEGSSETSYNLYTNSLSDEEAGTRVGEDGIIYSKREVILKDKNDKHDILLINMGSNDIPRLSVELESNVLEMDEYWTLSGNHDLSAFAGVASETKYGEETDYGELANMAKVRLRKISSVISGTEVEGTLTVKSEGKTIMVLELAGTAGAPVITTDDIPEAVKYVPYGTMIQNSSKYSKTKIRYALESGELPQGMAVMENGELYGVPKEAGEFNFQIRMVSTNPYANVTQNFTLVVKENTDDNVNGATDTGYDVEQRIPTVAIGSSGSRTFVSQGVLNEFVDVFLDGDKLVKGVDYSAESGSTRLTISSQTLTRANEVGTHTLGVEFRTSDENILKKAAQNFEVVSEGTTIDEDDSGNNGSGNNDSENNGSGSSSSGGSGNSGGGSQSGSDSSENSAGNTSGNPSQFTANTIAAQGAAGAEAVRTVIYTVEPGDTLSKIAVRYYGNASLWRKIYEDNRDVITNPNRIRVGMQIKLYLANVTTETAETGDTAVAGQYTIRGGNSLWKIARAMYGQGGQWRRIYEANRSVIPESLILRTGQVITIP